MEFSNICSYIVIRSPVEFLHRHLYLLSFSYVVLFLWILLLFFSIIFACIVYLVRATVYGSCFILLIAIIYLWLINYVYFYKIKITDFLYSLLLIIYFHYMFNDASNMALSGDQFTYTYWLINLHDDSIIILGYVTGFKGILRIVILPI